MIRDSDGGSGAAELVRIQPMAVLILGRACKFRANSINSIQNPQNKINHQNSSIGLSTIVDIVTMIAANSRHWEQIPNPLIVGIVRRQLANKHRTIGNRDYGYYQKHS